ncbi:MAG: phosphodiester glycosidase family protein [Tissierellaceae bacterium]
MKKTVKKVFLTIVAATTIMTTITPVYANKITVNMPYSIYETKDIQKLSSGVTYENIKRFTVSGWWNINVLRVDLSDEYTELKGLFNENGIPNRDRVSVMVDKHNALAAVNGDYFNYSPLPSAMGTLINDGEVISSPIELSYALPSFYLTNSNQGNVGYLDRRINATNLTKGTAVVINTLNKVTPEFDTLTVLNKNWGSKSIGNRFHNDLVEVLVKDNMVQEVRVGQAAFDIPQENGYVIAGRGKNAEALRNFSKNDVVNLEVQTVPDVEGIKFAIGGGSIILKDGELSLTNINSKGNQPRTGIGINKDSTELILVTIDGRDTSFKGVSQEMFGAILKELGAYNAMNLDGGGSTAMAIKPLGESKSKLVNKPSEGSERSVVNSVGIFSNAPKGELAHIEVSIAEPKMFVNTTRNIAIKGYDENYNPMEIDRSLAEFRVEGVEGTFNGNKFTATTSGNAKIIANYNGIEGEGELKVLGDIKDITTDIKDFYIDINSEYKLPSFYGKNINGTEARIYPEDIKFHVVGDIGYIEDGVFYSNDSGQGGAIIAEAGDGIENIMVSMGTKSVLIDSFETLDNYAFSPYPSSVTGSIALNDDAKDGNHSIALKYDFSQGDGTRVAYLNLNPESSGLKLKDKPKKLGLWVKGDSSGSWLRTSIKDASGKEHLIDFAKTIDWSDWRYVEANIPNNISYPITLQRIYVAETDSLKKYTGEILVDNLTASYPSTIGNIELPTPTKLVDEANKKSTVEENGFTFVVAHEPKGIDNIAGYEASKVVRSKINENKIAVFLNGISDGFKSGLKTYTYIDASTAYKTNKHQDTLFISLNSKNGGIRAANAEQWIKLKKDIETIEESNIILLLPTPVFGSNGFSDSLEAELFHDILAKSKEDGKNIFVVHGGSSNTSELKDGVRYIGLDTRDLKAPEDMKRLSLVEFVVNGDEISYQINKIFQ